ncbi:Redox-sensing transcriptional regulator QorR [Pseudonocardia sp. Ae168_Ps1]|uniref:winged helix-turn-helix transcriptional regulator n=1 Tax=unclassified Pseudonocardia TaxID=2619320 RepID=UPI00094AE9A9|nr:MULTISPECIES: helix-turn-helix domain-containing protein [unclassified Pseudonocardia]OLL75517.1 Redox-sensing transcriptional regulator QorR [Pseudonocardia sp. Ae150A_Ps1]OLL81512.1 Redox-sensing transcriptional regulator QorR [Pseudonocardia sp. Ae168_Ps1]OLL84375.1 Redox-sensing transcriptional regulator QorR [Pseudonocardia sp. Ae263_Ps1]OLL95607.1 Redox-sensing transcriptional regulator QorR [Pseudonocardia sp. Ae356_Ps1]
MSTQVGTVEWFGPGDAFDSDCPARTVLDHVTSKWAVLVLVALSREDLRFSALRRTIGGVSEKMLAQTLRTLEADGFVHREVAPTSPPQVGYRLTALGRDVTGHLTGLIGWINERVPDVVVARSRAAAGR